METNQEILQTERMDIKFKLTKLVEVGRPILEQSALVREKDFTEEDSDRVTKFFEASKPFIHPNVYPSYWEHIELAGRYSRILGERLKNKGILINPYELEVLGRIHDIGRIISPHRFFRNNLVSESLLKKLGVREDLRNKQVPETQLFGRGGNITSADQLTIEQQVLIFADNLGRKVESGDLIKFDQLGELTDQQVKQYQGEVFASERFGKQRLAETSKKILRILAEIKQKFEEQYNINIDDVRKEVAAVLS